MYTVRIYLLQRGCDVWGWYCARCLKDKESEGWNVRQSKDPPHALRCEGDACRAQAAQLARAA